MLDFRVDTFIDVYRTMNFTETAKELHITQPAVSQHIHFLEEYYQVKLFIYEGKKLRITGEGELLYRMVTAQKHDIIYLKGKLASDKGKKINLRFGVTFTIGEFVIAKPLVKLLGKFPELSVQIVTANTKELLKKITQGEIEFAVMEGNFPKEEYDSLIYSKEEFIPVCNESYQFKKRLVGMEELLEERLIIREEGSGTREVLVKDLERRNLTLEDFTNMVEIGNMNAIKDMLICGGGISFLYKAAVKEELERGILKRIPLEDFNVTHNFSFVWQKGSFFKEEYFKIFSELQNEVKYLEEKCDI